ncbi:hypothetical protein Trydic_g21890 [Trypoxylus dichotomus]
MSASFLVPQRESDRPTSPDSPQHFAGLVWKVDNRRPPREKRGRTFLDRRSPKKEARQPGRTHFPGRHHPLATTSQILGSHVGFPSKLGYPHTLRSRSPTSDVGNPLPVNGGARKARFLT